MLDLQQKLPGGGRRAAEFHPERERASPLSGRQGVCRGPEDAPPGRPAEPHSAGTGQLQGRPQAARGARRTSPAAALPARPLPPSPDCACAPPPCAHAGRPAGGRAHFARRRRFSFPWSRAPPSVAAAGSGAGGGRRRPAARACALASRRNARREPRFPHAGPRRVVGPAGVVGGGGGERPRRSRTRGWGHGDGQVEPLQPAPGVAPGIVPTWLFTSIPPASLHVLQKPVPSLDPKARQL